MQFSVNIKETYSRTVQVEADDEKDAIWQIANLVNNGTIILDDTDYFGRDIVIVPNALVEKYLTKQVKE